MVSCWFRQSTRNAVASHICEPGAALREPPIRRYPFAWSFFRSGLAETLNPTMIDRRDVPVTGLTDAELFAVAAGGLPEPREDSKMLLRSPHASHHFVFKNRAQERQLHEPDYGGLRFETVSSTVLPTATMVLGCGVWFEIQDFLVVVGG